MSGSNMPDAYIGKEQAYVKHTILRTYLQRLFMIVGQGAVPVINYVDCFAGPWQEEDDKLSDTSIGVSLEQMAKCQQSLKEEFNRDITFRALYIEKDPAAFSKLAPSSRISHILELKLSALKVTTQSFWIPLFPGAVVISHSFLSIRKAGKT